MAVGDVVAGPSLTEDHIVDEQNFRQIAPSGGETEWSMQVLQTMTGTTDAVDYVNPAFAIGRIVNGPYGPKCRFLARDDDHSEKTVTEFERSGTWATIRDVGSDGSCFEAFYEGDTNPAFRLGTDRTDGNYLEFQTTSDANNYVRLRRDAANKRMELIDPQNSDAAADLSFGTWYNNDNGNLYLGGTLISTFYEPTVAANAASVNAWSSSAIKIDFTPATGTVTLTLNYPVEGARWRFYITQDSTARAITWRHELGAGPVTLVNNTDILYEGGTVYGGTASGVDIIDLAYLGGTTYHLISHLNMS